MVIWLPLRQQYALIIRELRSIPFLAPPFVPSQLTEVPELAQTFAYHLASA